jgi:hypothetical protein
MLNCGVLPSTCGDAAAKVQGQALDGFEANGEHPEICVVGDENRIPCASD